jgi:hypothetical protein
VRDEVVIAHDQPAEAADPGVGPLNLPPLPVAPQGPAILAALPAPALAKRHDEFDPSPGQALPVRVAVVGPIGDHPRRLRARPARPRPRDLDRGERGLEERDFSW